MGNPLDRFVHPGGPDSTATTNPLDRFITRGNPLDQFADSSQAPPTSAPSTDEPTLRERFERIASDKQQRVETFTKLLARSDLAPAQRQRISRLLEQENESFFTNKKEEDRSSVENFFRGAADAVVRFGLIGAADTAIGIANLPLKAIDYAIGDGDGTFLDPLRETTRTGMEATKLLFDPEGKAGLAGQGIGFLATAGLGGNPVNAGSRAAAHAKSILSPWAVLNSAGYRAVASRSPAAAGIVKRGLAEGATLGERAAAQLVGSGALDVASTIDILTGPGTLEERLQAAGVNIALSAGAAAASAIPRNPVRPKAPGVPEPEAPVPSDREVAAQALETAKTETAKAKVSRASMIARSWNDMEPESRRAAVPGLVDAEYELKYSQLGKQSRGSVRKAIDELLPSEVLDTPPSNPVVDDLKAKNDKLRAQLADQVAKRRTEQKVARETIREAETDVLTGLQTPNRWQRFLQRINKVAEEGYKIVYLDVAGLKEYNDVHTHASGDQLLTRVGLAVRQALEEAGLRERDGFRAGGDEFGMYVPADKAEGVLARAIELVGDEAIPGSKKRARLFGGIADTVEEADELQKAARREAGPEYTRDPVKTDATPTPQPPKLPPGPPTAAKRPAGVVEATPRPAESAPAAADDLDRQLTEAIGETVGARNKKARDAASKRVDELVKKIDERDAAKAAEPSAPRADADEGTPSTATEPSPSEAPKVASTPEPAQPAARAEGAPPSNEIVPTNFETPDGPGTLAQRQAVQAAYRRLSQIEDAEAAEFGLKPDTDLEEADGLLDSWANTIIARLQNPESEFSRLSAVLIDYIYSNDGLTNPQIKTFFESLGDQGLVEGLLRAVDIADDRPVKGRKIIGFKNPKAPQKPTTPPVLKAPETAVKRDISKNKDTGLWEGRYLDSEGNLVGEAKVGPTRKAVRELMPNVERTPINKIREQMADKPKKTKKVKATKEPQTVEEKLEFLDKLDDQLERMRESGEITEEEFGRLFVEKVANPRAALRKGQQIEVAKIEEPAMRNVSEEEVIVDDVTSPPLFPELTAEVEYLTQLFMAGRSMGGVEGLEKVEIAKRGIRFNQDLEQFKPESLIKHRNELHGMLEQVGAAERELIKKRLADVTAEIARRESISPIDMLRNESGSLPIRPKGRPMFQPADNAPDYDQAIRARWVKGFGLNKKREAIREALRHPDQAFADVMYNLRRKLQNSNLPLIELRQMIFGGRGFNAVDDPATWSQLFSGWATRADNYLFGKPFQWDELGNVVESNIRGLRSVVAEVGSSYDSFVNYLIARRALETGELSGVKLTDAQKKMANAPDKFDVWAREITAYSNEVLEYARRSGMVSDKTYELVLEMNKNYIPLQRVFDGEAVMSPVQQFVGPGAVTKKRIGPGKPIYKLVGSGEQIIDPIQAIVENTRRLIRDADMNRVGVSLLNAVELEPAKYAGMLEIVKGKGRLSSKNKALFTRYRDEMRRLVPSASDQDIARMFDSLNREALGRRNDVLTIYRGGKRYQMRLRSDFADTFASMSPKHAEWYIQLLSAPTRLFKAGIVLNPIFSPLAAFKDALEATMRSQYGFNPWDSVRGFGIAISDTPIAKMLGITPSQYLKEFKAGGGSFTALSGVEARTTRAAYEYVTKGRGIQGTVLHPIDGLKRWARPFEEAARLGEFRKARLAGASVLESSIAARNVTVDFTQSGTTMQFLNSIVPFLNPAIQSISADMRAAKQNPAKVLAVGTGMALASWILAAANHDDQEIQDLRRTPYGSLFWWYRLPDGQIAKMPKPYFYGQLFATGAERAYDEVTLKDPNAAKRWRDAVAQQVSFTIMPTMIQWAFSFGANKDPLTGAPLVPEGYADSQMEPRFQVMPRTSTPAKVIGQVLNRAVDALPLGSDERAKLQISPINIDAFFTMALGSSGRDIKAVSRYVGKSKEIMPQTVAADLPVLGRLFGRYPSSNVEPLYYFYSRADRVEQVSNTVGRLIEYRPDDFGEYLEENTKDYIMAPVYASARKQMSDIRASIRTIEEMEFMDPASKRELIDEQMKLIIELARGVNEIDRSFNLGEP